MIFNSECRQLSAGLSQNLLWDLELDFEKGTLTEKGHKWKGGKEKQEKGGKRRGRREREGGEGKETRFPRGISFSQLPALLSPYDHWAMSVVDLILWNSLSSLLHDPYHSITMHHLITTF